MFSREKTKPGQLATCPICSEPLSLADLFSDNFAKREIMGLKVRCVHHEASCEAVMELRDVNVSAALAAFTIVLNLYQRPSMFFTSDGFAVMVFFWWGMHIFHQTALDAPLCVTFYFGFQGVWLNE